MSADNSSWWVCLPFLILAILGTSVLAARRRLADWRRFSRERRDGQHLQSAFSGRLGRRVRLLAVIALTSLVGGIAIMALILFDRLSFSLVVLLLLAAAALTCTVAGTMLLAIVNRVPGEMVLPGEHVELDDFQKQVLAERAYDDVHLGTIVWRLHGTGYDPEDPTLEALRPKVLALVGTLLESGLIYAERPQGTSFVRIPGSVSDVLHFINSEWDALGRTPAFGEVCWFRATPTGRQLAEQLGLIR